MGFAISWLAVKGKPEDVLISELGLAPTSEMAEYGDSMFTGRKLSSGWFLLVIDKAEHKFVTPNFLAKLSQGCEAIASTVEEHIMFCSSEFWRDGTQVWRIEHDAQKGIEHIDASGDLPADYPVIEQGHAEEQKQAGGSEADVDYYFEIPLHIAKNIVDFKHDEIDPAIEDDSFMVFQLEAARSGERIENQGKKPWWKLW